MCPEREVLCRVRLSLGCRKAATTERGPPKSNTEYRRPNLGTTQQRSFASATEVASLRQRRRSGFGVAFCRSGPRPRMKGQPNHPNPRPHQVPPGGRRFSPLAGCLRPLQRLLQRRHIPLEFGLDLSGAGVGVVGQVFEIGLPTL